MPVRPWNDESALLSHSACRTETELVSGLYALALQLSSQLVGVWVSEEAGAERRQWRKHGAVALARMNERRVLVVTTSSRNPGLGVNLGSETLSRFRKTKQKH